MTGAIDLHAAISKNAAKYDVSDLALTIGGETIRGTAEVDMARGRPMAKIDINAASASLPKIAAYLVDWDRQDPTAQIVDAASGGPGYWPNRAFALTALQGVDGTLKLKASTIRSPRDPLTMPARLEASLSAGI